MGDSQEQPTPARVGLGETLRLAAPIMLAYLAIGFPCGVMEQAIGFTPLMVFVLSVTYYSGAGQFVLPQMVLAGAPVAAIASTLSFLNMRQILYSTAFSAHTADDRKLPAFLFAATVTDESFGVNMERYLADPTWNARRGLAVNVCCMLSWAGANALGCALGPVVDLPIALLSYAMTSIFICLAVTQDLDRDAVVVMVATAVAVVGLKLLGLGAAAVLAGATIGVGCGMVAKLVRGGR